MRVEENPAAATTSRQSIQTMESRQPFYRTFSRFVGGAQGPLIGLVLLCIVFALSSTVFLTLRNA
jgi:hypothetical protein